MLVQNQVAQLPPPNTTSVHIDVAATAPASPQAIGSVGEQHPTSTTSQHASLNVQDGASPIDGRFAVSRSQPSTSDHDQDSRTPPSLPGGAPASPSNDSHANGNAKSSYRGSVFAREFIHEKADRMDEKWDAPTPTSSEDEDISEKEVESSPTINEPQVHRQEQDNGARTPPLPLMPTLIGDDGQDPTLAAADRPIVSVSKESLKDLADAVRTLSPRPQPPSGMTMFVGDQIITAILSFVTLLSATLGLGLFAVEVSCFIPDPHSSSDRVSSYIASFCSVEHAHGAEFVFWLLLQSTMLGLPILAFYQLWGAKLRRHVELVSGTVAEITKEVEEKIMEDARPEVIEEFHKVKGAYDRIHGRQDPEYDDVWGDPTAYVDKDELFDQQLRRDTDRLLEGQMKAESTEQIFDQAAAVVGLARYTTKDDMLNKQTQKCYQVILAALRYIRGNKNKEQNETSDDDILDRNKQWAFAFYSMLVAQFVVVGGWLVVWPACLGVEEHFQFYSSPPVNEQQQLQGHASRNAFLCSNVPLMTNGTGADLGLISAGLVCVYPPRYLFFVVWILNMVLAGVIWLVSVVRLINMCRRCPNDLNILFDACVTTNPDAVRIKSFAAYKKVCDSYAKLKTENGKIPRRRTRGKSFFPAGTVSAGVCNVSFSLSVYLLTF